MMQIVPMSNTHGPGVMAVFNEAISSGWAAFPENPLPDTAFDMIFKMTQSYPSLVLVDDAGTIQGFAFMRAYNSMPVFRRSAELSYFLSPKVQGLGYGSMLLQQLEVLGKACGVRKLIATVCDRNTGSIAFHLKRGFSEFGQLRDVGERKGELFGIRLFEKRI